MQVKGTALLNPGTTDQIWGLLKDFTDGIEADKEQVKNGSGSTVSVIYSDEREKVSATYTPLAAAGSSDPPKLGPKDLIGKELSVALAKGGSTITMIIEGAERAGSQGGAPSFKIDGYYYPEISNAPTSGSGQSEENNDGDGDGDGNSEG